MRRAAICIGHGPRIDKGAVNRNGTTELGWNTILAHLIARNLKDRLDVSIVHRTTERLQPVKETNATNADMAIELHLNSFNGKASGTEMIHHPGSARGETLANLLQKAAVTILGLPNRGVKTPVNGRGARWLQGTTMPAVIVESAFIDNDFDLKRATEVREPLAMAYADALVKFAATLD